MAPRPSHLLLALTSLGLLPLASIPLVQAQPDTIVPPASLEAPVAVPSPQGAAPEPLAPASGGGAVPAAALPARPVPARSAPAQPAPESVRAPEPMRPSPQDWPPEAPRRFDRSLDALVRDRVITPREVQIRVHDGLARPLTPSVREEGCSSGAFSTSECGGRAAVQFQRRDGGSPAFVGGSQAGAYRGGGGEGAPRAAVDAAPLPPISVPVSALLSGAGGSFRLTDVFRVTPRPGPIGGNGNARPLFPLIGSAVTTSNFGWRLHPLLGSWIMHSGRDLAAPEGTPVVAALAGTVVSSGPAGGYGLAIEIEHGGIHRRTLYGHLSELYVKEGARVSQGEVIGRVGSTGLSTGPHLHFEMRVPQDGGWVAIDPGDLDAAGSPLLARLPGLALPAGIGAVTANSSPGAIAPAGDAVALLMGELLQTLERPRSASRPASDTPLVPRPMVATPSVGASKAPPG
jgi:murein DD-endopeptidase MepM/ murein hydrolase activator NlpD